MSQGNISVHYAQAAFGIEQTINFNIKHFKKLVKSIKEANKKQKDVEKRNTKFMKTFLYLGSEDYIYKSFRKGFTTVSLCFKTLIQINNEHIKDVETALRDLKPFNKLYSEAKKKSKEAREAALRENSTRHEFTRLNNQTPKEAIKTKKIKIKLDNEHATTVNLVTNLQEEIVYLEGKKNHEVKQTLMAYFRSEMAFHAQSLELLTKAYTAINDVQEEADLKDFINTIRISNWTMPKDETEEAYIVNKDRSPLNNSQRKCLNTVSVLHDLDSTVTYSSDEESDTK